jgi:hypothetical protein
LVTIVGVTPQGFWSINRFNDLLRPLPSAESRMPYLARLKSGATIAETRVVSTPSSARRSPVRSIRNGT